VHVEAFAELGGAPATIVPDNTKAAVIRAAFGVDGAASLNRSYRELARHHGIKIPGISLTAACARFPSR
jgi:transposase